MGRSKGFRPAAPTWSRDQPRSAVGTQEEHGFRGVASTGREVDQTDQESRSPAAKAGPSMRPVQWDVYTLEELS